MKPAIARWKSKDPEAPLVLMAIWIALLGPAAPASAETTIYGRVGVPMDYDSFDYDLVVDRTDDGIDWDGDYLIVGRNDNEVRATFMNLERNRSASTGPSRLWRNRDTALPSPCNHVRERLPWIGLGGRGRVYTDHNFCEDFIGRTTVVTIDLENPASVEWGLMPIELVQEGDLTFETLPTAGGNIFASGVVSIGEAAGLPWLLVSGFAENEDPVAAACRVELSRVDCPKYYSPRFNNSKFLPFDVHDLSNGDPVVELGEADSSSANAADRILRQRLDIDFTPQIVIQKDAPLLNAPGQVGAISAASFSEDSGFISSSAEVPFSNHLVAFDSTGAYKIAAPGDPIPGAEGDTFRNLDRWKVGFRAAGFSYNSVDVPSRRGTIALKLSLDFGSQDLPSPGPERGPRVSSPGPARGPSVSSPGPARGPSVSSPGPARGPRVSSPGPARGPSVSSPGPARGPSVSSPEQSPGLAVTSAGAPSPLADAELLPLVVPGDVLEDGIVRNANLVAAVQEVFFVQVEHTDFTRQLYVFYPVPEPSAGVPARAAIAALASLRGARPRVSRHRALADTGAATEEIDLDGGPE